MQSRSHIDPVPAGNLSVDGLRCSMLVKLAPDASDIWYIMHACIQMIFLLLCTHARVSDPSICVGRMRTMHALGLAMQHGIRFLTWYVTSAK